MIACLLMTLLSETSPSNAATSALCGSSSPSRAPSPSTTLVRSVSSWSTRSQFIAASALFKRLEFIIANNSEFPPAYKFGQSSVRMCNVIHVFKSCVADVWLGAV